MNDQSVKKRQTIWPPAQWLRNYQRGWLMPDVVAGVTLAAYAIPVSLAYATLAGLPPHCGIYCYLLGGVAYALFGTSRQLAIGPTSAIAMLVGTTIAGMAEGDPALWAGIASLTALVVAILSVLAWLLRLSVLMSFVSETILLGFKAGAALTIALTQLPKLFAVPGGGEHFFEQLWILGRQLPELNWVVLGFGLFAMALLLVGEKLLPGRPAALVVVILSIVVMSITSLSEHGLKIVGELPQGLPALQLPSLRLRDIEGVIPLAFACFLLSFIESVSAARTLAAKNGYEVDPRQELLGVGAANFAVAFAQGFPVAGGLSQSAVNDKAGARSPLALIMASITLGLCLLYLTGLLRNLPTVVLAAVVLFAVRGLIDVPALRRLRKVSRLEFRISMVALIGVLLLGILKGVLLAAIVSLLTLITVAARPHVAFLGRIPGSKRFSDADRHPDNETVPGVLIFRVEASLLYFNVDHVRDIVWKKIQSTTPLRLVICDLSNSPQCDVAGARVLSRLQQDLTERGVKLRLVEAHSNLRNVLRAVGLEEQVGHLSRRQSVEQAIVEFEQCSSAPS
ncbi:MAG TPA: SulP family inorganic anion transporter [Planctomycetaceae bacterium]|nr:SulP family inorganic anion transporter [Planctomycetaceae bacterium]